MRGRFYEKYWEVSGEEHLGDFELKWPKLKKFIPQEDGVVILDFGCGNGRILNEIRELNQGARLIGVDISQTALEKARKVLPEAKFHKVQDGGRAPLPDNSVNFIFSSEVIEHIYDTENAVGEMWRVLKPGGKLLLTTPFHGFLKNILIALFAFDRHFDPLGPHIRFFSKRNLFSMLKHCGFKILKYGYYGRFYPVPHSIYVLAEK